MPSTSSELKLDPGPQPRRRSKLGCKCVLWTFLALICLISGYFGVLLLQGLFKWFRSPHFNLQQDLTVPYTPNEVVRPLVDRNQTFDIVATVWLRRGPLDSTPESIVTEVELVEEVIYSDTVFRALNLKDKNVRAAVNLSIPTEIFKSEELWNYDLRASFVLVPNSPSPLDFATNYSSWIPSTMYYPPMRPRLPDATYTLAEEIMDTYGIMVPLLEFHPVNSSCAESNTVAKETDDVEDDDSMDTQNVPSKAKNLYFKSTKGKLAADAHPYVKTRTHIRVADMTDVYNRKAYDQARRSFISKSCGREKPTDKPLWQDCKKSFVPNGNLETKIKLRTSNETTGTTTTEWAYAPYMDYSDMASGPMDLRPVPVVRERCQTIVPAIEPGLALNAQVDGVMNFTWNVAFSGRTPAKLMAANSLTPILLGENKISNISDYDLQRNHYIHQSINGFFGLRFEDSSHPRYLFIAHIAGFALWLVERFLDFHYWFSRSSTVGISIDGTILIVISKLADFITDVGSLGHLSEVALFGWIFLFIFHLPMIASVPSMLKVIGRVELSWPSLLRPRIVFFGATHAERASQRLDARTSRWYKLMAYAGLTGVYFICNHFNIYVISPRGPSPPPPKKFLVILSWVDVFLNYPVNNVGKALQITLNYRSKTFAGAYKLRAWLVFILAVKNTLVAIPDLFGHSIIRSGWPLSYFAGTILLSSFAWQAVIYPSASQKEDESTE